MTIRATIDDLAVYTWDSQARQYPRYNTTGIHYFRGDLANGQYVDCLLWYDDGCVLRGILNHYPEDVEPFEKKGRCNIWIHPGSMRQGIATALLSAAMDQWDDIDLHDQQYTKAGAAFARAFLGGTNGTT